MSHLQKVKINISPGSAANYAVRSCGLDNDEMVATRLIKANELIFEETPLVWCLIPESSSSHAHGSLDATCCDHCGADVENLGDSFARLAASFKMSSSFIERGRSEWASYLADHGGCGCKDTCRCPSCSCAYCSSECRDEAQRCGHGLICGVRGSSVDPYGHLDLALRVYARVVQRALAERSSAADMWRDLLGGVHAEKFTESTHALRTGSLLAARSAMFTDTIAPAYFDAALRPTLELLRSTFAAYTSASVAVILTESYLDTLIGTFLVNNVSFAVPSLLETFHTKHSVDDSDPSASAIMRDMQLIMDQSDKTFTFKRLYYTALFKNFAKMNHDCRSSTFISSGPSGALRIRVHASREIVAGGVISNSYLHTVAGDPPLSKTDRRRALCQYLFTCSCALCESEPSDDGDY